MRKSILLIIEDDSAHLHVLELMLEKHGYDIITASDGEEALKKLTTLVPDLVLLDLVLPKVSGAHILAHIRVDQRLKNVPVIVCTVLYDDDMKKQCEELGISGFYKKTQCSLAEIENKIQSILKGE